jgi:hypothetical protein
MREGGCRPIQNRHKTTAAAATMLGMLLAAMMCILAAPTPAQAQKSPIPIRLKLGILSAQDRDVRNYAGTPLYGGEVEVGLPGIMTGQTVVSLGYFERRKNGNSFRVVPLTVSRLYSPPNPASGLTGNVYFGFGGGLYYLTKGGSDSDSETTFGGFGVAGYRFPKRLLIFDLVEAKFHLVAGKANGLSPNGLTLMVGMQL